MTPRLTFRPVASREIREARRWYEHQHAGLGLRFLDDLEAAVDEFREHPRINRAVTDDEMVRRALLRTFPYSVVYEIISADELVVLACRHVRRDEIDISARRGGV